MKDKLGEGGERSLRKVGIKEEKGSIDEEWRKGESEGHIGSRRRERGVR